MSADLQGANPLHLPHFVRWIVTGAWFGFIFYMSTAGFGGSLTGTLLRIALRALHVSVLPETFEVLHYCLRKLAHLTEYAILALLLYASNMKGESFEWRRRLAFLCVLIAGVYSLTDEYHQSFVAGRTASIMDCGIDAAGAGIAMLGLYVGVRVQAALGVLSVQA